MKMQWKIGNVEIPNPFVLAPMAGVTDLAFRRLCKEQGAGLICMEMVSAKALLYKNRNTKPLLETRPEEEPVAVQLFGSDPEIMSEMALQLEEGPYAIIDVNMGCPVPKIVNNGEGSALMKDPKLVEQILTALVKAIDKPVTVKIRKGFDDDHVNAVEIAKIAEACGVAAVAVHGRTRAQYYSGQADWDIIAQVKDAVKIPVIGNGDVDSPEKAKAILEQTGCDGVMIGRAAYHYPWRMAEFDNRFYGDDSPARTPADVGKSLDFPGGGILSGKRHDPGKTHEPGEAGNDPAPCGIAAGIQGRIHRCPGDAQAPVLVYGGNAPFRSFPPDHQYHGENGRTDPGSAGNLSGRSVVRILDTAMHYEADLA